MVVQVPSTAAGAPTETVGPAETVEAAPRRRGRPRLADVDARVLEAAQAIEREVGYYHTTIEAIAERAGVARTAIYRRWPNKGLLLYEAMIGPEGQRLPVPDTGDVQADLMTVIEANASGLRAQSSRGFIAALSAEALQDERLAALLRERFFGPRADAIASRVATAVARRELRASIDPAMVPVLLTGSLQYLWLVRGSTLDTADLERVLEAVIGPHRIRRRSGPA